MGQEVLEGSDANDHPLCPVADHVGSGRVPEVKALFLNGNELGSAHPLLDRAWQAVMVMPYTDQSMAERAADIMVSRAGVDDALVLAIQDIDRMGFVGTANEAFERTSSEYFGYVAQDAFPGRQWLSRALKALVSRDKSFLGFNDGKWMGVLASFGLAKRAWAMGNYGGAFFYPGYRSHYADVELTVLAMSDGAYCYDPNSVLVEVDWGKDDAQVTAEDRACYRGRVRQRFGDRVSRPELLTLFA